MDLCARVPRVITVEDRVLEAGFGSAVLELLADEGLMGVKVKRLRMLDRSMNRPLGKSSVPGPRSKKNPLSKPLYR